MPRPLYIAVHAVLAGVFFYALQRFAMSIDHDAALSFSAAMAIGAGGLAYYQTGR